MQKECQREKNLHGENTDNYPATPALNAEGNHKKEKAILAELFSRQDSLR